MSVVVGWLVLVCGHPTMAPSCGQGLPRSAGACRTRPEGLGLRQEVRRKRHLMMVRDHDRSRGRAWTKDRRRLEVYRRYSVRSGRRRLRSGTGRLDVVLHRMPSNFAVTGVSSSRCSCRAEHKRDAAVGLGDLRVTPPPDERLRVEFVGRAACRIGRPRDTWVALRVLVSDVGAGLSSRRYRWLDLRAWQEGSLLLSSLARPAALCAMIGLFSSSSQFMPAIGIETVP